MNELTVETAGEFGTGLRERLARRCPASVAAVVPALPETHSPTPIAGPEPQAEPTELLWPIFRRALGQCRPDGAPDHNARIKAALELVEHVSRLAEVDAGRAASAVAV